MKNLLRLEELAQFLICLAVLAMLGSPWWIYVLLIIGPDIGMLGYLVSARIGAITYNLTHHKGMALLLGLAGVLNPFAVQGFGTEWMAWVPYGIVLYGHSSMDRMLGFGLKYGDDFKHTHLGWIGRGPESSRQEQ